MFKKNKISLNFKKMKSKLLMSYIPPTFFCVDCGKRLHA